MSSSFQKIIESRISVNQFEPQRSLSDEVIQSLITQATRAPSAYNMQNWRFVAVRSEQAKERLKAVSYGQQKVVDACVTFIVCGTLSGHLHLSAALRPSVEAGFMTQQMSDAWASQAKQSSEGNSQLQRDQAIRSASLAAMTLMLAVQDMGLGSCPMSGFDAAQVSREFSLKPDEVPVMLVAVGYPKAENWPQKPRKAIPDVLTIV